jgi:hypothetical protein
MQCSTAKSQSASCNIVNKLCAEGVDSEADFPLALDLTDEVDLPPQIAPAGALIGVGIVGSTPAIIGLVGNGLALDASGISAARQAFVLPSSTRTSSKPVSPSSAAVSCASIESGAVTTRTRRLGTPAPPG